MGGHVAGAARIGIVAPGAADLTILLDNEEILHPRGFETGRHGDPAEAAADDQNFGLRGPSGWGGGGRRFGGDAIEHEKIPDPRVVGTTPLQIGPAIAARSVSRQ